MARVRLVAPEEATEEQRAAFAAVAQQRGAVYNLFRAMVHSPAAARHVGAVGAFLRFDCALPPRLREAAILEVAGRWGCAYERHYHEPAAARAGLSEATIAALVQGRADADLSPLEAAAVQYALALSRDGRADAALAERLRAELGEAGLVELTVLVGYYSLLAMFLNGLEVDVDA